MRTRKWFPILAATALVLSMLACIPTATSQPPPVTITPFKPGSPAPPTVPPATVPPATVPPATSPPTEPPPASWLPEGTFALYAIGPWGSGQLYALSPGPTSTDLGRTVSYLAAVSRTGRWIASTNGPPPASDIVVTNLENGTVHPIPLTPDFTPYDVAFDLAETRLAFMELGPFGPGDLAWAVVVVDLATGTPTRFETTIAIEDIGTTMLPGRPIGWSASGNELLLNTFRPGTEGNWGGVWAVTLPPGATSAPLDTLGRRELVPLGSYYTDPQLSPDATRLLYLNRDFDYTPSGYQPMAYDLAVNELWSVDIASGARTLLVDASDGSALARSAAWLQEAPHTLFAQGNFAGDAFASLALKARDEAGTVRNVGSVPLPPGGGLQSIDWCLPDFALVTVADASYNHQLHIVDFGGGATLVTSAAYVTVIGCIP